jgi:copper chaperone CopZ
MNRFLSGAACAAMLLVLTAPALRADDAAPPAAPAPAADQPAHVTLAVAALESSEDADKIITALKGVKGVNDVTGLTMDSKRAVVTYMPGQVSVQQIAQAVADVPGKVSNPFRADLLIHVENLSDTTTQDKAKEAVKKVTGVSDATVPDATAGNLDVQFAPMETADKAGGVKGVTQDQLLQALKDAGLTATAEIIPMATAK